MSTHVTKENLQEFASKLHAKNKTLFALKSQTGTPSVVTTAASMTDQTKIYVYMGTETGYIKGGWYYYSGSAWTFGGMYNSGDWIGDDLKQALLQLASKVAYIDDDGQDYYDALESALYHDATLVSISAVYTQSGTVYETDSLNSLKSDLVVTATFSDASTTTITAYTLSGTLTAGTSTITVAYSGKTTTFAVAVTPYTWIYRASDGELLSAQDYVVKTTGGSGGTETLSDSILVLDSAYAGSGSNFIKYTFADDTTQNGKIRCKAYMENMMMADPSIAPVGFRLQLSNGTGGAQAYFFKNNGLITIIYFEGTTKMLQETTFDANFYHVFEVELTNGHQKISIDGELLVDSTTLSTNYASQNAIFNQAGKNTISPNGTKTHIEWLGYIEVA